MKKNKLHQKSWERWLFVSCVLLVIAITAWGCTSPILSSSVDEFVITYFHEGWSQQIGDYEIPLEDIHDYESVEVGESLIFTCILPEIDDNMALLFYSIDKEVECYVDGVLIQQFTMQEGFTILKTPGSAWNQVDFDSSMSGKTCTIIFYSPLGEYDFLCDIHLVESQYVNMVRLNYIWQAILAVGGVCLIMVAIIFTAIVEQQSYRRRYLLSIACHFLIVLLWLLAELNAFDLIFLRPIISHLLSEVFKRILPISLLYLAKHSTNQYWHPKLFRGITILVWANLFVPFFMQFTIGIALLEMGKINCLVSMIIGVLLLYVIGEKFFHFKALQYEEYPCLAIPILVFCGGVDTYILYYNNEYLPFLGVWTALGCIVFSMVSLVLLNYVSTCVAREKRKIEQTCSELENITLVKQLEAHFIFNALNAISAFCKADPEEADKGIRAFAKYLRTYLHLINQKKNIPFGTELDLVVHYLEIQQMRVGERLNFSVETEFLDFEIPPFAVHTLVENAVIHGIMKRGEGGEITISTRREGDNVQVIIVDTGVGFDVTKPIKESSVGMENTKKRLEIMSNGTITINSTIGVGTTVVIAIPIIE